MIDPQLPIAVLGAGPVGLAAAAHLTERGLSVVILEAAPRIAASLRAWGHVRMFSPWRYDVDPAARRLLEAAQSVEGTARHASTHAAGVVISGDPLADHVPLQKIAKNDTMVMTQYPQKALDHIGLLKMDFLGLANLTMLAKCVEYVKETRGIEIDLSALP
nr:FAD-dependent oxidoreductase [Myxococcota bacterium]